VTDLNMPNLVPFKAFEELVNGSCGSSSCSTSGIIAYLASQPETWRRVGLLMFVRIENGPWKECQVGISELPYMSVRAVWDELIVRGGVDPHALCSFLGQRPGPTGQ
jgi:hypothetical protein